MPHPSARLIPIADFAKGTNQAPGFMRRAQGAAEEMENLVVDLQGRPVVRDGYTEVDTTDLSIGTEAGYYTDGDQLVVIHWLGDEDTPAGIKRIYRLPHDASWVHDDRGRLLFIASPSEAPYFRYYIDVKENIRYAWALRSPRVQPGIEFTDIHRGSENLGNLEFERDVNQMRLGIRDIVKTFTISDSMPLYIKLEALTDIVDVEVSIETEETLWFDIRQNTLYSGHLIQGSYLWLWDGRNQDGDAVDVNDDFLAEMEIHTAKSNDNVIVPKGVNRDGNPRTDDKRTRIDFQITSSATDERFTIEKQLRFGCLTYANEDLNIESAPSPLQEIAAYDVAENTRDLEVTFDASYENQAAPPVWATHLYIYISKEAVPFEYDYEKAVETGFEFRRVAKFARSGGAFESTAEANPFQGAPVLDSYEHDAPVEGLDVIGAYGVGIWGADKNTVYFNKIGNQGEQRLYALPSENALVPHSFTLAESGQSPILHIHPTAHESALLVFKRDAIHIIKGKGVITGLYDPVTPVTVDIDASGVIVGTGTMSPRSVLTVGSAVYFVGSDKRFWQYGSDWRGQTRLRDVGLPIQKYLDVLTLENLENLVAFLYQNCYHLVTPDRVLIMDMTRNYWTSASWQLKDAFWSRGGINSESILYGVKDDSTLVELFKGETDGDETIGAAWQSNPIPIPSESSITGVIVVHTDSETPTLKCRVDVDDVEGEEREFEPAKSNDFRCGLHSSGSRISVRLESDEGFPKMDRVQAEVFLAR